MKHIGFVIVTLASVGASTARADLIAIGPGDFAPDVQVITFETGSTGLPTVPGVTFLQTTPSFSPWFGSSANFTGFFGAQGWSNVVSVSYSDLGIDFATPVQAIGGYVGRIPNFAGQHPPEVIVELFDSTLTSLGTASITLPPAFNSPVFFGFTADSPIARFRMTGNNSGFFGVDNFTFGALQTQIIPEPQALSLAAIGVGLLCAARATARRFRSSLNRAA
jgi:hypothetical protein